MTARNLSGRSDIGGASNSVPQINPVFSYPCKGGGYINIYVVKGKAAFAVATYDDTEQEFAFAVQTLPTGSNYEVYVLLVTAEEEFTSLADKEYNPFRELLSDVQALSELYNVVYISVKGE